MQYPSITFGVITMNRRDDLAKCLTSLQGMDYPNLEILVVDNGSHDDTARMVRAAFPEVRLIVNETNHGAGGGRNDIIANATGDLIAFMDDDTTLEEPQAPYRIAAYFQERPRLGCLCFAMLTPDTHQVAAKTMPRRDKKVPEGDETPCGHFLGGGVAMRKAMLQETGVFWDKLHPYGSEEFELSFRILEAGWDILWTRRVCIIHWETQVARPRGRRIYYEVRHRPWVALCYLPLPYVFIQTALWWGYMLWHALRTLQVGTWLRGVLSCLHGLPDIWRHRRVVSADTMRKLKQYSGPLYY